MIAKFKYSFVILTLLSQLINAKSPNCELIDYKVICTVTDQRLVQEEFVLIQINNKQGDDFAKIEIPYSKKIKVIITGAQIEMLNGTVIRSLKKSEIKDQSAISAISLYEDDFIKKFELIHNEYPYRIRYSYKYQQDEFHEIISWYPVFHTDVPTKHASLEIHTPLNYPIVQHIRGEITHSSDTTDSQINYKYSAEDINSIQPEYYAPSLQSLYPTVRVVPMFFKWITNGNHKSWLDYGNWINSIIQDADKLTEKDKQLVQKLISGKADTLQVIKTLYHYLQDNFRYINISINTGGLKPYPAEYVSTNRYGDCKALSVYLKALLQAAGINSFYTTIYAGDDYPGFIKDLACHQSNHVILTVPLKQDTIYLECTNNSIPCGYLGTFTQNREALMVTPNASKIIKTPALSLNNVKENKHFVFEFPNPSECKLHINNSFRGFKFDYLNSIHSGANSKDMEDFIRERFLHFSSFELLDWNLSKPDRDSACINFQANLSLQNFFKSYGTDFGFSYASVGLPTFEPPIARKLPLDIEFPVYLVDSFRYVFKFPFKIKSLPTATSTKSKFGEYSIDYNLVGKNIEIFREFKLHAGSYSLQEYPDFYAFINEIQNIEKKIILITKI